MSHETPQSLENDGHRTVIWREEETVRLQARSGRDVTANWMDLALAAFEMLPPGEVLDGEAVIYTHERIDFAAAQSRALSTMLSAASGCSFVIAAPLCPAGRSG
jgi:ATP-dependent DNA ligase